MGWFASQWAQMRALKAHAPVANDQKRYLIVFEVFFISITIISASEYGATEHLAESNIKANINNGKDV